MAELKTQPTQASVTAFLARIGDEGRRRECRELSRLMREITGCRPVMWGSSIVGFGKYRYRYETGREGEWFLTGFSPRKNDLTIYVMSGLYRHSDLVKRLGKHRHGKSCLYLKNLQGVDRELLVKLIGDSVELLKESS